MLNISHKTISDRVNQEQFESFKLLRTRISKSQMIKLLTIVGLVSIASTFLPWTQNIRAKGYVTTLSPDARPQSIQALVGGKIVKWYVQEGQIVNVGDTIMQISEVKQDYLDPQLLDRTSSQIEAKKRSGSAYSSKASSLNDQYTALSNTKKVKLEQNEIKIKQTLLKIQSDSIDLVAERVAQSIAEKQLIRIENLYNEGLKSLTDYEQKKLKFQEVQAKLISLTNKLETSRRELESLYANRGFIKNDYDNKMAKSQSDKMSALSAKYEAEVSVNKLESNLNSYNVRQQNYFITSPISGRIAEAQQSGIGEIIKDGASIVTIMPNNYALAVEMYVNPVDVPLLEIGQPVRIQFDGWPAIVFSGWPNNSYGTFGGKVFAIDNFISDNGKYRILVEQDEQDIKWPYEVRVGGGANTITLLKRVSVGYELWRQLNGFPPDYYKKELTDDLKSKAPLKKIK